MAILVRFYHGLLIVPKSQRIDEFIMNNFVVPRLAVWKRKITTHSVQFNKRKGTGKM